VAWPHHFFIHSQTPVRRGVANFTLAVQSHLAWALSSYYQSCWPYIRLSATRFCYQTVLRLASHEQLFVPDSSSVKWSFRAAEHASFYLCGTVRFVFCETVYLSTFTPPRTPMPPGQTDNSYFINPSDCPALHRLWLRLYLYIYCHLGWLAIAVSRACPA